MKKKLLIIYPQLDTPYSGGQVIDFEFIHLLENESSIDCNYITDSTLDSNSILGYNCYFLKNILKIRKYDIIFTNSRLYPRLLLCFLLLKILRSKSKIITYHHHFNYQTQKGLLKWMHKFFELMFLKLINIIIIPSPFVRDQMNKVLPKSHVKYIEIGFDLHTNRKTSVFNNKLLFVGTIEKRKRIHHLIEVADFLKRKDICFHINIIGKVADEVYYNDMLSNINNKGLENNITFHGRVEQDVLNDYFNDSCVFVFPTSHEGYGMVIIEAMNYGLPVIAYNNSAIPYSVIDENTGLLATDNNVNELCEKVYRLLNDKRLWKSLSVNACNYTKTLPNLEQMKAEMTNYIKNEL